MSAPDRMTAALADRYTIERELGEGGMATVYLADDLKHERKVALKVLKPELAAVVGAERFLSEIKTTANLQHPHILPLFDSGEAGGFLYYVMPFVEGESLRDRLDREGQLPVDEAVRIAAAVAHALDSAHRQGVIHRDVKPANILLLDGQPVVTDFGIALAVSAAGGGRLTETGLSLGTPYYMSPEQATADRDPGARSDVYSLGCVLYEMLLGEPPHTGSTAQAILGKILTAEPRRPTEQRRNIPANVEAVVLRSLEKLPADRFATAGEMAAALAAPEFRHQTDAHEAPATAGTAPGWARPVAWVGLGGLIVGVVVGRLLVGSPDTTTAPPADPIRFEHDAPHGLSLFFGQEAPLALSPDGRTLAYTTPGGIAVRPIDAFEAWVLPNTEGAITLMFSPDGTRIGFIQTPYLRWVPVEGGPVVTVTDIGRPAAIGGMWADDGGFLWASGGSNGILWISEDGTQLRQLTEVAEEEGENIHAWPQDLPGTEAILYTSLGPGGGWADGKTVFHDPSTGETRVLVENGTNAFYSATGHLLYVDDSRNVLAVPFDASSGETTGPAAPVAEDVRRSAWGGGAGYTVSRSGAIAWIEGSELEMYRLVAVDRFGAVEEDFGITSGVFIQLSPDASRLLVNRATGNNIDQWILDLDSKLPDRFTFDIEEEESAVWSPDGGRVLWAAAQPGGGRIAYVQPTDRSGDPEVVFEAPYHLHVTDWSSDGRFVTFYEFHPTDGSNLYVVDLENGNEIIPVAASGANEEAGKFSPDGRWLAYQSNEDGADEVFAVPVPGFGPPRQLSSGGGMIPDWHPDQTELYYFDRSWFSGEPSTLIAREVRPGDLLSLGAEERLFTLSEPTQYVPLPRGRGFYTVLPRPEARAFSIKILLNGFGELPGAR